MIVKGDTSKHEQVKKHRVLILQSTETCAELRREAAVARDECGPHAGLCDRAATTIETLESHRTALLSACEAALEYMRTGDGTFGTVHDSLSSAISLSREGKP